MSPQGCWGTRAAGLRLVKLSSLVTGFQLPAEGTGFPNLPLLEPALLLHQSRDALAGNSHVGWLWHVPPLVPCARVPLTAIGAVRLPLPLLAPPPAPLRPAAGRRRRRWSHPQPASLRDPIPRGASHSHTGRG